MSTPTATPSQEGLTFVKCLRMRRIAADKDTDVYETFEKAFPSSSLAKEYAFGGFTAGQAVMAAHLSLYARQRREGQQEGAFTDDAGSSAESSAAQQLHAAEVDKDWCIYSCLGNFLGPVSTRFTVRLEVTTLRRTRSFETRLVRVLQPSVSKKNKRGQADPTLQQHSSLPSWTTRFVCTIDFCRRGKHAKHSRTGEALAFSIQPHIMRHRDDGVRPDAIYDPTLAERNFATADRMLRQGSISKEMHKHFYLLFDSLPHSMEMRCLPGGLCERSLQGTLPSYKNNIPNKEEYVDASAQVDGVWFKTTGALRDIWQDNEEGKGSSMYMTKAALAASFRAMMLDPRPVIWAPLIHRLEFGRDYIGQSLDTAIRFHSQETDQELEISANDFHYVETTSRVGGHGRYFGESSCFDRKGRLVATCSQQCAIQVLSGKPKTTTSPGTHRKEDASKL